MFIDVSPLLSISSKHVEAVEAIDDLNSLIHTTTKSFEVAMPKSVILSFLGTREEDSSSSRVEKLLRDIYQSQSTARP